MAHQIIPVADAVQGRIMEKVILSGSPFCSSMLGSGAYHITPLALPVYYTDPVISGPSVMGAAFFPSLLTCDGGHFHSSPRATLTYSWEVDQVAISPAETGVTYAPIASDVGKDIRCFVTATNSEGADTAYSNEVEIFALAPMPVYEMDIMPITGMPYSGRIDINDESVMIMSGMGNEITENIHELDGYALTGMAVDDKQEVLAGDVYGMFVPTMLTDLVVVNGDAENSVMTDWTMDTGEVFSVTSAINNATLFREGARFFNADSLGTGVDSQMSQVIEIPAGDLTDIDTGRCYCVVYCLLDSEEGRDSITITIEAQNAAFGSLGSETTAFPPTLNSENWWIHANTLDDILNLPTLTRHVKITVLFKADDSGGGPENGGYVDDIQIKLMKA